MTPPKDDAAAEPPPILRCKNHRAQSIFPRNALLREARRQKGINAGTVPDICILDPHGDMVRHLIATNRARRLTSRACYHTDLHAFKRERVEYEVVSSADGASFAVLVVEELFAPGCKLLG